MSSKKKRTTVTGALLVLPLGSAGSSSLTCPLAASCLPPAAPAGALRAGGWLKTETETGRHRPGAHWSNPLSLAKLTTSASIMRRVGYCWPI